jgi:GxxExxY protein
MKNDSLKHSEITGNIIKHFYKVYNELGYGFAEKVYENSLRIELTNLGYDVRQQRPVNVFYHGTLVGEYFADILVNNSVIIELKSVESLCAAHESQLLNYLKATNIEVGILLNFGPKPDYKRKLFSNDKKNLIDVLIDP